jgi:ELWxxDGT repeat protein
MSTLAHSPRVLVSTLVTLLVSASVACADVATPRIVTLPLLDNCGYTDRFQNIDGYAFFRGGCGLWRSNGRPSGTVQIATGSVSYVVQLTGAPTRKVCFTLNNNLYGADGTSSGSWLIRSNIAGMESGGFPQAVNGRVVFGQVSDPYTSELWASDGSPTAWRISAPGGQPGSRVKHIAVVGNNVFYATYEYPNPNYALWASDGSPNPPTRLMTLDADLSPITDSGLALVEMNGRAYFFANNAWNALNLWTSDGTVAGTHSIASFFSSSPTFTNPPVVAGVWPDPATSSLYIATMTSSSGGPTKLWRVTVGNPVPALVLSFAGETNIAPLAIAAGHFLFDSEAGAGTYGQTSQTIRWITDGSPDHTLAIHTGSLPEMAAICGDSIWFMGSSPDTGIEPWRINFDTLEAGLAVDLAPGPASPHPSGMFALDMGRGVGFASEPEYVTSPGIWTTGPSGGTATFIPIGPSTTAPDYAASIRNRIFYWMGTTTNGYQPAMIDLCTADYDNSGDVTVGDLFLFLNDWFAGNPDTHLSGSAGPPATSDILTFVGDWLAGCP